MSPPNRDSKNWRSVSIVVPAYNEEQRLGNTLRAILDYLKSVELYAEIIVVNDGSLDNTAAIAEAVFADFAASADGRVISYDENRGKGYAVRTGMALATAEVVLFSDADLSTPISEMEKLIAPIANGTADVVFGSRALDRSLIASHQSWKREQGGKVFNAAVRLMTGLKYSDTQCGFKAFRRSYLDPILRVAQIDRFGFDVELLFVAQQANLRLLELPVLWSHCEGSKVNMFRDSRRMLTEVFHIRRNVARNTYLPAVQEIEMIMGEEREREKSTAPLAMNAYG